MIDSQETETQLRQLSPLQQQEAGLKRLAQFLGECSWCLERSKPGTKKQIGRNFFDEARLDTGEEVALKSTAGLESFFRLSYECHIGDIGSDPEGI